MCKGFGQEKTKTRDIPVTFGFLISGDKLRYQSLSSYRNSQEPCKLALLFTFTKNCSAVILK